jgi:pyrroloquinoline-quinone synthase
MRLSYTTALYHDYVAADLPLSEITAAAAQLKSADAELVQA